MARFKQDIVQIDSGSTASEGSNTDGMLLSAILFPSTMTGTTVTMQWASSPGGWKDVKETDGSAVSYTVLIDSMGGSPHVDFINRVDEDLDLLPEPLVGLGVIKMGVGSMGV